MSPTLKEGLTCESMENHDPVNVTDEFDVGDTVYLYMIAEDLANNNEKWIEWWKWDGNKYVHDNEIDPQPINPDYDYTGTATGLSSMPEGQWLVKFFIDDLLLGTTLFGVGKPPVPEGYEEKAQADVTDVRIDDSTVNKGDTTRFHVDVDQVGEGTGPITIGAEVDGTKVEDLTKQMDPDDSTSAGFDIDTSDLSVGDHTVTGKAFASTTYGEGQISSIQLTLTVEEAEEPEKVTIEGVVKDAVLGEPILGATVSFAEASTTSDFETGEYSLEVPPASGPIEATASDFVDYSHMVTLPESGTFEHDIEMDAGVIKDAVPEPGADYEVLPDPPADFPDEFLDTYKDLDDALADEDVEEVLNILEEHAWDTASPIAFIAAISAGTIIAVIGSIIGSYTLEAFLQQETIQAAGLSFFEDMRANELDLAQESLDMTEEYLGRQDEIDLQNLIPFWNIIHVVNEYKDISRNKLELDQELVDREITDLMEPDMGDFTGYAKSVYEEEPDETKLPKRYSLLVVDPNVESFEIEVDGVGMSMTEPFEKVVSPGLHDIKVSKPGYRDETMTVDVDPFDTHTENPFLEEKPPEETTGTIEVITDPDGADVYLDGELHEYPSNTTIEEVEKDGHTVRVEKEGYKTDDDTKDVDIGETTTFEFDLEEEEPDTGSAEVITEPTGADVYIDDELQEWETNTTISGVSVGEHTVKVELEGYKSDDMTKNIEPGEPTTFDFGSLEELPPELATVNITTDVGGVEVSTAEGLLGTTDEDGSLSVEMEEGSYELKFSKEGYKDTVKYVWLEAGDETAVEVIMTPIDEGRKAFRVTVSITDPKGQSLPVNIFVNGYYEKFGAAASLIFDPGTYVLTFKRRGYETVSETLELTEEELEAGGEE